MAGNSKASNNAPIAGSEPQGQDMHPKLSPRHQSQREPSEEDHENEEEDSDGSESSEDGTVEEMDKCDGGCECRVAQSFCWYHRSMVQQVSKTRSSLEEAEKAGTAEPELKLHLNVDETAIEMGLIPRSWSTDGNYDLGMYRLYLVDDSFKLTEDDTSNRKALPQRHTLSREGGGKVKLEKFYSDTLKSLQRSD